EDVLDSPLLDEAADLPDPLLPPRIVASLVQRWEGIGDRPLCENALHLGRTCFHDCHSRTPFARGPLRATASSSIIVYAATALQKPPPRPTRGSPAWGRPPAR